LKKLLILTLFGFTILSCNSDDDNILNNSDYSQYISENSIDTNIEFMPEEIYNDRTIQKPSLKLKLITSEIFPCFNYGLLTNEFTNDNELVIRFNEIITPEICLTAFGPAISYIDLPENTDKITFINGNIIDKYSIEIIQTKISITLIESNFTDLLYKKTFRIPENSFAYVSGTNTNNTNIYYDFLEILNQNPNFEEFEFEGDGRIPYPESSDGHWINHPSKFFKYSNFEDFNDLASVLNNYSTENIEENSGVSISIYSWNNTSYYSWINN